MVAPAKTAGTRAEMGWELVKQEATNGIEGRNIIDDALKIPRNAIATLLRGSQQFFPIIANAASNQRFRIYKGGELLDPTINAGANIVNTARRGNPIGTVSAVIVETPDVLVDTPLTLIGASQWHVRAIANDTRSKTNSLVA